MPISSGKKSVPVAARSRMSVCRRCVPNVGERSNAISCASRTQSGVLSQRLSRATSRYAISSGVSGIGLRGCWNQTMTNVVGKGVQTTPPTGKALQG